MKNSCYLHEWRWRQMRKRRHENEPYWTIYFNDAAIFLRTVCNVNFFGSAMNHIWQISIIWVAQIDFLFWPSKKFCPQSNRSITIFTAEFINPLIGCYRAAIMPLHSVSIIKKWSLRIKWYKCRRIRYSPWNRLPFHVRGLTDALQMHFNRTIMQIRYECIFYFAIRSQPSMKLRSLNWNRNGYYLRFIAL